MLDNISIYIFPLTASMTKCAWLTGYKDPMSYRVYNNADNGIGHRMRPSNQLLTASRGHCTVLYTGWIPAPCLCITSPGIRLAA